MHREEFLALLETEHKKIVEINRVKGHDYAGDEDALANFKREAEDLGMRPEQVWAVYASKHWSAVKTFCREGDVASEPIEGRLQDVILYCYLLLGLIEEKKQELAKKTVGGQLRQPREIERPTT